MKPIRLSGHARGQLFSRGVLEEEILDSIVSSPWSPAELGRSECRKDFLFGKNWNDKYYDIKQVRPIFVEEEDEIVVVTVYSYYFSKEN